LLPEEGSIAVIVGVPVAAVPKAKQLGTLRVTPPENVRVIVTGVEEETASGNAGVVSVTAVGLRVLTRASRVTPADVKVARVVAAVPGNRPPLIVSTVPPVLGPELGEQLEKNGAGAAADWKTIFKGSALAVTPENVAVALTKAVPVDVEQSVAIALPFCVTTETTG